MKTNIDIEKYELWNNGVRRPQRKVREASRQENKVRERAAQRGYRLMHRRRGQFWVMFSEPMALNEIERLLGFRRRK